MHSYESENLWMICLNCEHDFSFDDIFTGDDDVECPHCGSKSFRKCDSFGLDIDEYRDYIEEDEWY